MIGCPCLCTGANSRYGIDSSLGTDSNSVPVMILVPEKNGIITPLVCILNLKVTTVTITTLQCALPFDLGPVRRRTRNYSFSESERSITGTPTPSDLGELTSADEDQSSDPAVAPKKSQESKGSLTAEHRFHEKEEGVNLQGTQRLSSQS